MIRLSKSCISEAEKASVISVLDSEYLGMGKEVQLFEQELTDFFGRPAVAVASGTTALQFALEAAGIGQGDEVLVPSLTYVASFQAIRGAGAVPVACDVDATTLTLCAGDLGRRVTARTKAIMPVHYAGAVGDIDSIFALARQFGLRVIEDAAHAFGTKYREQKVGSFGDITCFSFDGIKNITCGEGGCVSTDDLAIIERIKDIRLLGVEKDTDNRFNGKRSWDFDVSKQGWRGHMSNIMAAIGRSQLRRFPELASRRQYLASKYVTLLSGLCEQGHLRLITANYENQVPHIFPVVLAPSISRDDLRLSLLKSGVETGVHYKPAHHLTLFSQPQNASPLPVTEDLAQRLLTLPLHPDLTDTELKEVVAALNTALIT